MAYRKKYRKRVYRRYRKKKSNAYVSAGKSVGGSVGNLVSYAVKGVRRLTALVNVERKYFDHNLSSVGFDNTTPLITNVINNLAQGTSANQRGGDVIRAKGLSFRYTISKNTTTTKYRLILLMVHDTNNFPTAMTDVYDSITLHSHKRRDHTTRYKTLHDKVYHLNGDHPNRVHNLYIPLNHHIKFQAGSTTLKTNSICAIMLSDVPPAGGVPSLTGTFRMIYIDN